MKYPFKGKILQNNLMIWYKSWFNISQCIKKKIWDKMSFILSCGLALFTL